MKIINLLGLLTTILLFSFCGNIKTSKSYSISVDRVDTLYATNGNQQIVHIQNGVIVSLTTFNNQENGKSGLNNQYITFNPNGFINSLYLTVKSEYAEIDGLSQHVEFPHIIEFDSLGYITKNEIQQK